MNAVDASALSRPVGLSRLSVSAPLLRLRSDDQLVALFRAGHDEAFGVIHDRYRARLFAYSRQMLGGSASDAEDVLQDVFLRAYDALRVDARPLTLRAWLYRVAHNRCIDQLRRPAPAEADIFDVNRAPLHDTPAEFERREDLRRLIADVQRLPEQQRSALLMREMNGLSYVELSGALGVTVPAVKSLLVRARIGLVEAIEARDTACADIRTDLAEAFDRGVRASGRSRRHLRECGGCREYRSRLRTVDKQLNGLVPSGGPFTTLAKILGIGGSGAGAAAGGGAAATSGGAATVGTAAVSTGGAVTSMGAAATAGGAASAAGSAAATAGGLSGAAAISTGAAAATATKVAAVVAAAAVVGGGAATVERVERHVSAPAASHAVVVPAATERTPSHVIVRLPVTGDPADAILLDAPSATQAPDDTASPAPSAGAPLPADGHPLPSDHGAADPKAPAAEHDTGGLEAPDEADDSHDPADAPSTSGTAGSGTVASTGTGTTSTSGSSTTTTSGSAPTAVVATTDTSTTSAAPRSDSTAPDSTTP